MMLDILGGWPGRKPCFDIHVHVPSQLGSIWSLFEFIRVEGRGKFWSVFMVSAHPVGLDAEIPIDQKLSLCVSNCCNHDMPAMSDSCMAESWSNGNRQFWAIQVITTCFVILLHVATPQCHLHQGTVASAFASSNLQRGACCRDGSRKFPFCTDSWLLDIPDLLTLLDGLGCAERDGKELLSVGQMYNIAKEWWAIGDGWGHVVVLWVQWACMSFWDRLGTLSSVTFHNTLVSSAASNL